jgi:protein-S-isoprenylcysteine O-methyltransferase Ste14
LSEPAGRAGWESRLPSLGPCGEGWLALQLILIVAVAFAGSLFEGDLTAGVKVVVQVAGIVVSVGGLLLMYRGYIDLRQSFSPLPRPTEQASLTQRGVYRRLRHPIYTGVVLAAIGWGISHASLLALALSVVLAVVLDLKARREEVWLRQRYPDYGQYASRTKKFVPGIY